MEQMRKQALQEKNGYCTCHYQVDHLSQIVNERNEGREAYLPALVRREEAIEQTAAVCFSTCAWFCLLNRLTD